MIYYHQEQQVDNSWENIRLYQQYVLKALRTKMNISEEGVGDTRIFL